MTFEWQYYTQINTICFTKMIIQLHFKLHFHFQRFVLTADFICHLIGVKLNFAKLPCFRHFHFQRFVFNS